MAGGHLLRGVDQVAVFGVGAVPDGFVQLPVAHLAIQTPGPRFNNETVKLMHYLKQMLSKISFLILPLGKDI